VRGLIVRALKEALAREGQRAATTGGGATIAAFRPLQAPRRGGYDWRRSPTSKAACVASAKPSAAPPRDGATQRGSGRDGERRQS